MKTRREESLYPYVERWMKRHFRCFKTGINTGLTHSRIDVVGVRDAGGDLSGEVETIAIEVKRAGSPFATTSGQTVGYRVYADRTYLAKSRKRPFTSEEMDVATHLGIGLIQIRDRKCNEILSSPSYTPIRRLNLRLLENLGLGRCQLCDSFFEIEDTKRRRSKLTSEDVYKAIQNGTGLTFWNYEVARRKKKLGIRRGSYASYERRFICLECVEQLLAIQHKRLEDWFSHYQKGR